MIRLLICLTHLEKFGFLRTDAEKQLYMPSITRKTFSHASKRKKMENKNAIIFDMDGTLIDSETIFENIAIEVFAELNVKLTDKTYSKWKGMPTEQIEHAILEEFGADFPLANFKRKFIESWEQHIHSFGIKVIPGIKELLDELSANNIKIGVATSTPHDKAVCSLKIAGINIPEDRIIGGDMVKNGKPSPEIFLEESS